MLGLHAVPVGGALLYREPTAGPEGPQASVWAIAVERSVRASVLWVRRRASAPGT